MADPKYEIDDQGNLVEVGSSASPKEAEGEERPPVTPQEARRFLLAIALSEFLAVIVLVVALLFAMPGKPALIAAITAVYALFSVGMFLYLRRDVYGRVKDPE